MPYKLKEKENEFQTTREGEFEYHTFRHGVVYDKVPEEETERFEKTDAETRPAAGAPQNTGATSVGDLETKKKK